MQSKSLSLSHSKGLSDPRMIFIDGSDRAAIRISGTSIQMELKVLELTLLYDDLSLRASYSLNKVER